MRCGLEKKPALIFDRKHLLLAMGKPTTSGLQPLSSLSEGSHPSSFLFPLHIPSLLPPSPTSNGQCKQTWSEQTPRPGWGGTRRERLSASFSHQPLLCLLLPLPHGSRERRLTLQ